MVFRRHSSQTANICSFRTSSTVEIHGSARWSCISRGKYEEVHESLLEKALKSPISSVIVL